MRSLQSMRNGPQSALQDCTPHVFIRWWGTLDISGEISQKYETDRHFFHPLHIQTLEGQTRFKTWLQCHKVSLYLLPTSFWELSGVLQLNEPGGIFCCCHLTTIVGGPVRDECHGLICEADTSEHPSMESNCGHAGIPSPTALQSFSFCELTRDAALQTESDASSGPGQKTLAGILLCWTI